MAATDLQRDDEGNVMETIYSREENNCDVNTPSAPEAKDKRDKKRQRKRSTSRGGGGGGGILKNFRRRGSQGSFPSSFFDPDEFSSETGRKLISKCPVELTMNSTTKLRILFLYEDVLIIVKQKSSTSFHLKIRVDLRDIWLKDDYQDPADAAGFGASPGATGYRLGWPIATTVDLEFPTVEEKNSWVENLQTLLTIVREKENHFVIVRLAKNDEQFSVTKKCQVGKTESARNVLARCAKKFHSKSDIKQNEFQLQAMTNANEDPIPLTGSEILYRIQMNYNREHGDGRQDMTAEGGAELTGDGLVFQVIPLEKKLNIPKISVPATAEDHHNRTANGTSLFARVLFRTPHERLYRRNLSELYKDGKLCHRLMMMLSHLYVNGPSAEEVFRRPPAYKTQRVLQEKFESGKEVNFDKVNACEMGQLLKTFLSCLPECLLTNELYDEWFAVPKQEDRTAMISLAKSLVDRLPVCNLVLLRHLMCVLRRISGFSAKNGMPPKSLSICIGQCLLWLPTSTTANEIESEFHRVETVNRVTEVLIDNALDIFGEECFHLFDHLHQQPPSPTNGMKEKSDVIGSMETETETATGYIEQILDMTSEPVLITSSSDQDITMHSIALCDPSSADGTTVEMGLLDEVNQEMALRLNGPSLLQGAAHETPFDLSHSSSLVNLCPEKQSITDDNNNEEEDDEEEEEERRVKIENSIEVSNQFPAEDDVFHLSEVDASSTPAENPLRDISLASVNMHHSDIESNSSTAEKILPSMSGRQASNSVFPVACLDMASPIPILILTEISETSDTPAEVVFMPNEESNQLNEPTQLLLSASAAPATTKSMKLHTSMLVVPSLNKTLSVSECVVESSPVTRISRSRPEISSTTENKSNFPGGGGGRKMIPSPDDGYSTSSMKKTSRGSGSRRESDLNPSRIEKRFSPYSENVTSPSKLSLRSPFLAAGRSANSASSDSGLRSETSTARSPSSAAATDQRVASLGIVRRLTSQIEKRELDRGGRRPLPPSPQSAPPRGRLLQSPFSPNFKGTSGSISVSPSPLSLRAVHSDTSSPVAVSDHSTLQHSNRESSLRPELPSNPQRIEAIKNRSVDPVVSPSDNMHKAIMLIDTSSKVTSTMSKNLLTVANKAETKPNADLLEETEKPVNEQIISSSPRPTDSFSLTNTEPEVSSAEAKERTSNKASQETTTRGEQHQLRHSDPKMTPSRQAKERRRSSGGDDLRSRNKENKENNNVVRSQLQKRPSPAEEVSSTRREKVSRISPELLADDIGKLDEEISPVTTTTTTTTTSETKKMSVKNRDWHRQLTEQYSTAPAALAPTPGGPGVGSVKVGGLTSQRNVAVNRKPPPPPPPSSQRPVARIDSKISYTPVPIRVFHVTTERSRPAVTSATAKSHEIR